MRPPGCFDKSSNNNTEGRGESQCLGQTSCVRRGAYLAIIARNVCICEHLREHRTVCRRAIRRIATGRELELLTKEHGECGALLGYSEREELGNPKSRDAGRARIVGKCGVDEKLLDLSYCALKDHRPRGGWWEGMGILCIILRREL
jgi:hypothetical protein